MIRTKKILFVIILAMFCPIMLVGCASTPSAGSAQTMEEAQQTVDIFNQQHDALANILNKYMQDLQGISDSSIDPVTGYSDLKQLETTADQLRENMAMTTTPARYANARSDMEMAVNYLGSSIDEASSYMDNQKVSDLSNAQDDLKSAMTSANQAMSEAAAQAAQDGYQIPMTNQ